LKQRGVAVRGIVRKTSATIRSFESKPVAGPTGRYVDWIDELRRRLSLGRHEAEEGWSLVARREEDVDWIDEPKKVLSLGRQKNNVDWIDEPVEAWSSR